MRVLVTGGGGFIAAWIMKRLFARGAELRVFDVKDDRRIAREVLGAAADSLEWQTGDIASGRDVARAAEGADLLIHLAAVLTPA
jgi:nucleoside-diphosphate-sugar epimerase